MAIRPLSPRGATPRPSSRYRGGVPAPASSSEAAENELLQAPANKPLTELSHWACLAPPGQGPCVRVVSCQAQKAKGLPSPAACLHPHRSCGATAPAECRVLSPQSSLGPYEPEAQMAWCPNTYMHPALWCVCLWGADWYPVTSDVLGPPSGMSPIGQRPDVACGCSQTRTSHVLKCSEPAQETDLGLTACKPLHLSLHLGATHIGRWQPPVLSGNRKLRALSSTCP